MSISELTNVLEAAIASQGQCSEDEKAAAKDVTKGALFALLKAVSLASKDDLPPERRQQLDDTLMKQDTTILKWPLLRSLSIATHYRAFLGLPKTMEQTRRYLTTISGGPKLQQILVEDLDASEVDNLQDLQWIEQVLQYMTGDGRRKKDLGGFVLQNKGPVRAALNKLKSRQKEIEAAKKSETTMKKPVVYQMERDIRIVDAERQGARASDFSSLVEDALHTTKK